jgi:hypothetical protein
MVILVVLATNIIADAYHPILLIHILCKLFRRTSGLDSREDGLITRSTRSTELHDAQRDKVRKSLVLKGLWREQKL